MVILDSELFEFGRMLERKKDDAVELPQDLSKAKNEFLSRVRDLALGIPGRAMKASSVALLSRSRGRLPEDCVAVLDLEPGSTFAEAIVAGRALRMLVRDGADLVKRRGDYFIRNRREGRVFRVNLFRLGRELGLQGVR